MRLKVAARAGRAQHDEVRMTAALDFVEKNWSDPVLKLWYKIQCRRLRVLQILRDELML